MCSSNTTTTTSSSSSSSSSSATHSYQMNSADREEITKLAGNSRCVDCSRFNPEWASVSLGVLFCLDCSGKHRSLGTHVSFVRSITMDSWTDTQLQKMKLGGNRQCQDFLAQHGVSWNDAIQNKYNSPAAGLYRQVLTARVEGTPEPTELPEPEAAAPATCYSSPLQKKKQMTGFGGGYSPAPKDALLRRNGGRKGGGFSLAAMLSGRRRNQPSRYGAHLVRTNLSHDAI